MSRRDSKDSIGRLRELFRGWVCDSCRAGDFSKCRVKREDARAYIQGPDGKIRYFCQVGCLLLQLGDEAFEHAVVSQYNREGHYHQLRNSFV